MKQLFLSLLLSAAVMAGYAQDKPTPKQCKGTTVKNEQCKMRAVAGSDFCRIHNPDVPRCGVKTSKGQPCKRQVKEQGQHCWQHQYS